MRLPPAATAFARSSPQTPSRFCQPRGIEPRTLRTEADSLTTQLDWAVPLLLQYIKGDTGKDLVFAIQKDTSSDLTKESHLSIIFQWCDNSLRVFTALYGFILVGMDERGVFSVC